MIMGNTAERVLEQLKCSVLALKPRGFMSPITP
jgi:nucleotide-binding universal stress UspA family protein